MSEERRKKKLEREQDQLPPDYGKLFRKVGVALLIVAAFATAYYLGTRKRISRLDTFAQCMSSKGAKMYGLSWCPHCEEQKEMFESAFQYIDYTECGIKGEHKETESCIANGLKQFPTWQFPSGERHEGALPLTQLAQKTGCSLP
jgi:glutaredoxin